MTRLRAEGLNQIYLDETKDDTNSNISAGFLIRSSGAGLRTAYIDCDKTSRKFINLLENLSLITGFKNNISKFHIEIFSFKNQNLMQKTLLPLVEYYNISKIKLKEELLNFETIIIENLDFENISLEILKQLIRDKNILTELIVITKSKEIYNKIKDLFQISIEVSRSNFLQKFSRFTILEKSFYGQTQYLLGYITRKYLQKKDIKYISFKKNIKNSEEPFLRELKKIHTNILNYGKFDYVYLNLQTLQDEKPKIKEIENQLMLLETSIKKQSIIIVENLFDILITDEIREKVIEILSESKNELLISTQNLDWRKMDIEDYNTIIFKNKNNKEFPIRFGIDF